MAPIIISIERTPRTFEVDDQEIQVEELSVCLPFSRKPCDLNDLAGSESCPVYITETVNLTPEQFDAFASDLLRSRNWLAGKGGYLGKGRMCVAVHAPGRPWLFVDPSGGSYGRYVARVG